VGLKGSTHTVGVVSATPSADDQYQYWLTANIRLSAKRRFTVQRLSCLGDFEYQEEEGRKIGEM
jgi:hypothetical protein